MPKRSIGIAREKEGLMATLGDGFKSIFLAGIGAVAIGAEKGKELVDQLVARGEMTVEQGKQINTELKHRADETASSIRRDAIEARMSVMTPDERIEFAAIVREMADSANAKDAAVAAAKVEAATAEAPAPEEAPGADAPAPAADAASEPAPAADAAAPAPASTEDAPQA